MENFVFYCLFSPILYRILPEIWPQGDEGSKLVYRILTIWNDTFHFFKLQDPGDKISNRGNE